MDTKKHVTELLSVYIDGMCTPEERKQVEEHLPGCVQCRQDLADLRQTIKLVAGLKEIEPPTGIWEGIENKIAKKPLFEIFGLKPVPAAVITFAVLLIAVSINKYTTNITRQTKTAIPESLAPMVNIPIRPREKLVAAGQAMKKKENFAPAPAGNMVMDRMDNFSVAPAKDSCGVTAVSEMKSEVVEQEAKPAVPYEIEMQVADMEKSFRQLEELAKNHHAKKLSQKDSEEMFLQIQEQQFNDFINELNKVGRISRSAPSLGAEPEGVAPRAPATPKLIKVKFSPAR